MTELEAIKQRHSVREFEKKPAATARSLSCLHRRSASTPAGSL